MSSVRQGLAAAAAATFLMAASAAGATVIDIHATGTVDPGSKWNQIFPTTGDLGGLSFVYNATYDLSAGFAGDNFESFDPNSFSASLEIGGNTLIFGGADGSSASLQDEISEPPFGIFSVIDNTTAAGFSLYHLQIVSDDPGGLLLLQPPYGDLCAGGKCADGDDILTKGDSLAPLIQFNTTQLVVSAQGGVPEPSSWALMILGFGAAGTILRRRRRLARDLALA